jgi:hypothetical protein
MITNAERCKKNYWSNREERLKRQHEHNQQIKKDVLTHYGNGKCACVICGFDKLPALSIDHIDGGGNEHRRQLNIGAGIRFYLHLKKDNYPDGYRTLCQNCQHKEYGVGLQ